MSETSTLAIELMRIPDEFDEDAQHLLGTVAEVVQASREHVWGTRQLSNEAQDIFRDLKDPYERVNILCAYLDDRLVGRAEVRMPLISDTDVAQIVVDVDPGEVSEGIGRALLAAAEQFAQGESRRVVRLITEHPPSEVRVPTGPGDGSVTGGAAHHPAVEWIAAVDGSGELPASHRQARFAQHSGYELQTVSGFALLSMPLPQERRDGVRHSLSSVPFEDRYRLHTWVGAAPEALLEPLARLHARIPSDSFVQPLAADPDPWDAQRVRRTEELRQENGDRSLMAVIEDITTGELAGMTELILADQRPTLALQDETLVVKEHRGRRLGMRLKLANVEQLTTEAPEVTTVYSWIHTGNHRMNLVNAQLGFQEAGQSAVWLRDFRTL